MERSAEEEPGKLREEPSLNTNGNNRSVLNHECSGLVDTKNLVVWTAAIPEDGLYSNFNFLF